MPKLTNTITVEDASPNKMLSKIRLNASLRKKGKTEALPSAVTSATAVKNTLKQ